MVEEVTSRIYGPHDEAKSPWMGEIPALQGIDPDLVAEAAFRRAARLTGIDLGLVFLVQEDGTLWPWWGWGAGSEHFGHLTPFPIDDASLAGRTIRQGRTLVVAEPTDGPIFDGAWSRQFSPSEAVAVPLHIDREIRGVFLGGWLKPLQVDETAIVMLEGVASHVAAVLQRSSLVSELEAERSHLDNLLDVLPFPVRSLSGEPPEIRRANAAARDLFGDVAGRPVLDVIDHHAFRTLGGRPLDADQVVCALRLWTWTDRFRVRLEGADGAGRVMSLSIVPSMGNGETLVSFRDVTPEFHFEQTRSRFVMLAAHHLRTPLTSILGFTQLVGKRLKACDELAAEAAEAIIEGAQRLEHQVARLQAIAELHPVHPSELRPERVRDLVELAWSRVGGPSHQLVALGSLEAAVRCRSEDVLGALMEVLDNSLVHGRPPVEVEIVPRGRVTEISVCDLGPGIGPAWSEVIFAPYTVSGVSYVAPEPDHLGLGLAVARARAESTGGSLHYEPDQRAFVFTFLSAPEGLLDG